jgi:hypothetical protein
VHYVAQRAKPTPSSMQGRWFVLTWSDGKRAARCINNETPLPNPPLKGEGTRYCAGVFRLGRMALAGFAAARQSEETVATAVNPMYCQGQSCFVSPVVESIVVMVFDLSMSCGNVMKFCVGPRMIHVVPLLAAAAASTTTAASPESENP